MSLNDDDGADRRRVVVVDDDPLFLSTLTLNLEDAGFDVSAFTGGSAALDHLNAGARPDAIILDWHMPGRDGLTATESITYTVVTGGKVAGRLAITGLRQAASVWRRKACARGILRSMSHRRA